MPKLKIDDLAKIREKTRYQTMVRLGAGQVKITVHMGTCGIAAGARGIMSVVIDEVERRGMHDIIVTNSGCAGLCSQEPMVTVESVKDQAPVKYVFMTPEKVKKIIDSHIVNGQPVKEYALAVGSETTR